MPQSHARVLIHIIFATKRRQRFIRPEIENDLFSYMAATLKARGAPALIVGGADDHVHILASVSRTVTIADVVEEVKTGSSKWIKTRGPLFRGFAWQAGYGVFSVGPGRVEVVKRYIAEQREHHRRATFQEEYVKILKAAGVDFDERYMWD